MSEKRPLIERFTAAMVRKPYADPHGSKGLIGVFTRAQPHVVRRYTLVLPGWPRFPRPLRIAFLSDFHIGSHTGDIVRHTGIAVEVAALAPDVVLFGGDYMNMQIAGRGRVPPETIARLLARMNGRSGRFAILGNHDYLYGRHEVAQALRAAGIAVIEHGEDRFTFGKSMIRVVGMPDAHIAWTAGRGLLAGLPREPAIVLTHDPMHFADVPAGPFLTLAGHTHGGQVRLPGIGAVTNASRAPMRWTHGLVVEGGRHLIVTAGLGTSGIPLRIGVPPEYVIVEVTGA